MLLYGQGGVAATFDGQFVHIEYHGYFDLCGTDPAGTSYTMTIQVQLNGYGSQTTFDITFLNPCVDPVTITGNCNGALSPIEYILGGSYLVPFQHGAYTVNGPADVKDLCGPLHYTADFGDLSAYVTYDTTQRSFTINMPINAAVSTTTPYVYSVSAELANYPGSAATTCSSQINIVDPCENPDDLVIPVPQNADCDYINPAIFTFPPNYTV